MIHPIFPDLPKSSHITLTYLLIYSASCGILCAGHLQMKAWKALFGIFLAVTFGISGGIKPDVI